MDEAREPLPELAFRGLTEDDHAVIKQLHEDWFPVRYSAGFYDAAVRGRMVGTGEAIFHLVAEDARTREMVGLVTAQLTDARRCGDALFEPARDFDLNECERVVYVLTLGTVAKYRRRGVSTELLRRCLARAEAEPRCGCVYLHVITYNAAAIAFYERAGFERVREIPNYYRIEGEDRACCVYARFLDRARRAPARRRPSGSRRRSRASCPRRSGAAFPSGGSGDLSAFSVFFVSLRASNLWVLWAFACLGRI